MHCFFFSLMTQWRATGDLPWWLLIVLFIFLNTVYVYTIYIYCVYYCTSHYPAILVIISHYLYSLNYNYPMISHIPCSWLNLLLFIPHCPMIVSYDIQLFHQVTSLKSYPDICNFTWNKPGLDGAGRSRGPQEIKEFAKKMLGTGVPKNQHIHV